jgi:hypothetical protein
MSEKQRAWTTSPEGKAAALRAMRKARAVQAAMPRCGAIAKSTGEPCKRMALENGRCEFHGGRTPKGSQWHRLQLPNTGGSERKFDRKLAAQARRQKTQAVRVAAMSEKEREAFEAWRRSHEPGGATEREQRRQNVKARKWLEARPQAPASPEEETLTALIEALKSDRDRLVLTLASRGLLP